MSPVAPRKSWPELIQALDGASVKVWSTASALERVQLISPWSVSTEAPSVAEGDWIVAVGGGKIIDQAKLLKSQKAGAKLAAVPTIWGSGAEASPIAVWGEGSRKVFRRDATLLPDLVVSVPEFSESLSPDLVRWACGDAWAHALEGFLSPLAGDETRQQLSEAMRAMLELGVKNDAHWFELSARACAGQAESSVGLVHGIAHVTEAGSDFGHARLCATLLLPVMRFNKERSPKWPLLAKHGLREEAVLDTCRTFFDSCDYSALHPIVTTRWRDVLRDPCTRTNSALVRPDDLFFFEKFAP